MILRAHSKPFLEFSLERAWPQGARSERHKVAPRVAGGLATQVFVGVKAIAAQAR